MNITVKRRWEFKRAERLGKQSLAAALSLSYQARTAPPNPDFLPMLVRGILNPQLSSLLARIRHTNTVVIADRGFPYWPGLETVDLSLVDNLPTVPQVLEALLENWTADHVFMAEEFVSVNNEPTQQRFLRALRGVPRTLEPHAQFKLRVPSAIGLIRTGETVQYANMILRSG